MPVPGWLPATGTAHPLPWPCSCIMVSIMHLGQHGCKAGEQRVWKSTVCAPVQGEAGKLLPVGKEESSLTSFVPLVFSIIIKPLPPCLEMAEHLSTLLCHFHTVPSASALGNAQECAGRGSRACQACVQCLAAHAKV